MNTELYTLNGRIVWYINYISIKLLKQKAVRKGLGVLGQGRERHANRGKEQRTGRNLLRNEAQKQYTAQIRTGVLNIHPILSLPGHCRLGAGALRSSGKQ